MFRGRSYGTRYCHLLLKQCQAIGLTNVVICCDEQNIASIRVIEHNYGWLKEVVVLNQGDDYDAGLVFASLLRNNGIPMVFVQTIASHSLLESLDVMVRSCHTFLELYLFDRWILLDPATGHLYTDYQENQLSLPNGYCAFLKSLNGSKVGIVSAETYRQKLAMFIPAFQKQSWSMVDSESLDLMRLERKWTCQ